MMKLSESATDDDRTAIVDALQGLPAVVPEIRSYSVGLDAGLVEGNFELVVVGEFDNVDDYQAYSANSDHQEVIATLIRPFLAERSAVQYVL